MGVLKESVNKRASAHIECRPCHSLFPFKPIYITVYSIFELYICCISSNSNPKQSQLNFLLFYFLWLMLCMIIVFFCTIIFEFIFKRNRLIKWFRKSTFFLFTHTPGAINWSFQIFDMGIILVFTWGNLKTKKKVITFENPFYLV